MCFQKQCTLQLWKNPQAAKGIVPMKAGDNEFCKLSRETAHQIRNTSTTHLEQKHH